MKRTVTLFVLLFLLFLGGSKCSAQKRSVVNSPVFDAQAASEAYLAQLPPGKKASSDKYFEGEYWLYLVGILYTASSMLLLLVTGMSVRIRDLAVRMSGRHSLQATIYCAFLFPITCVLQFPLAFYRDFVREHQYGLSTQSLAFWLRDFVVGWALLIVFLTVLCVALFAIVRRMGRSWWIWGTSVAVASVAISLSVFPVFVYPLFNDYAPMEKGAARDSVLSMARANGIPVNDVYVVDSSRQTTRISANVSGFLGTERISLNDNLLRQCSLAEIRAVMGHEIGHYVLNHNLQKLLFLSILALFVFRWLDWSIRTALQRWGKAWRVSELGDPAVTPLAVLTLCIFFLATTPVRNGFERSQEYEADIFGLNAAGEPDGLAQVALKFADYRKMEPTQLEEAFFYDHPSGRTRIYSAMRWKAEHTNLP